MKIKSVYKDLVPTELPVDSERPVFFCKIFGQTPSLNTF